MQYPARVSPVDEALAALEREKLRLLRVERIAAGSRRAPTRTLGVRLTFDAGRLLVEVSRDRSALRVETGIEVDFDSEADVLRADEDEPWWALLGNDLCRARRTGGEPDAPTELELQFRPDGQNPKLVTLALVAGELRVSARRKEDA
jgi:hypothetical protein